MSKPMVVTLPCALLLLDLWPLNRVAGFQHGYALGAAPACAPVSIARLVGEKLPFFALVAAGSLVTFLVQSGAGAVAGLPLRERLANAVLAYAQYIGKLFWPSDLAIIYPHPSHWPLWLALVAVALLLVWTLLCLYRWRQVPYLVVGWFWFVGTLVPTIGLIQVGAQSMADRYTYIPSIGLFVVVAWGLTEYFTLRDFRRSRLVLSILAVVALIGCVSATVHQISFWRDSIALFRHAIDVTTENYAAENCLGKAYELVGNPIGAMACYQLSVQTEARYPYSQFNLAMALLERGQTEEALEHLQVAARLEPRDPDIQYDLGIYFSQHNRWTNAAGCFSNSLVVRPGFAPAQLAMGGVLANLGRAKVAAAHLREALRLDPNLLPARTNLDRLLAEHPEVR
jgi:tetratricopeptide (TPR) repeat protein